ncbi:MAG: hypothetical protein ACO27F_05880 [Beijerinckiaceae bacterium]
MTKSPSRAALASARQRYDAGEPVAGLAAALGLSADAFRRLRRKQGWPLRPSPIRRAQPAPQEQQQEQQQEQPQQAQRQTQQEPKQEAQREQAPPRAASPPAAVDLDALRARLERALQSELAAVERRLTSADPAEPGERNARALASLVKTFAELRRLAAPVRPKTGAEHDRPADATGRDVAALRAELARRLAGLEGEERGG